MTKYEKELKTLKPYDPIQYSFKVKGYTKITTAGHGYLVVPKNDPNASVAKGICKYGFVGDLAYYLEEDCELAQFLDSVAEKQLCKRCGKEYTKINIDTLFLCPKCFQEECDNGNI